MPIHCIAVGTRRLAVVATLGALGLVAACATPSMSSGKAGLAGVWELVSVTTRWPDGRVSKPWGAAPVGRITYGADGRMAALLMDARRNQADGRDVPAEVQASAAAYYGTYEVDSARQVVTHHVAASLRVSEAGTIERRFTVSGNTLVLTANALYEGERVTHTLVWRRAAGGER